MRSIHVIYVTLHKMVDGREDGRDDERATFQFIKEVQNCPDLWDASSAAYKDTKKQAEENGRTTNIRIRPNLSIFPALSVSSSAINIQ